MFYASMKVRTSCPELNAYQDSQVCYSVRCVTNITVFKVSQLESQCVTVANTCYFSSTFFVQLTRIESKVILEMKHVNVWHKDFVNL